MDHSYSSDDEDVPDWVVGVSSDDALGPRLEFCQRLLPRTESFALSFSSNEDDVRQVLTTGKVPLLEILELTYDNKFKHSCTIPDPTNYLWESDAPQLRTVLLDHVFVSWTDLAQFTTLTKLHICFTNRCDLDLDDADILRVFQSCSRLQDVRLECHDLLHELPKLQEIRSPVQLRHLRLLHLEFMPSDLSYILQAIAIPKHITALDIVGVFDRRPNGESAIKLPADPQCIPCFSEVSELSVDVAKCKVSAWGRKLQTGTGRPHLNIRLRDGGKDVCLGAAVLKILNRIQKIFSMPHLTILTIRDKYTHRLDIEDFVLLLRHSPSLRKLRFHNCGDRLLDELNVHLKYDASPLVSSLTYVEFTHMKIPVTALDVFCRIYFDSKYRLQRSGERRSAKWDDHSDSILLSYKRGGKERKLWIGVGVHVVASKEKFRIVDVAAGEI